jgi:hypothetical protein
MQRRFYFGPLTRILTAALLAVALLSPVAPASLRQQASVAETDVSALSATGEILKTVSRLRELSIIEPVKSGFKTHDQIEESVIKDLNENSTPEEFDASSKTLTKLGLIPPGFQLRDYMVKLLKEQIAGYYEPKTKLFYLAAWLPISEQKTVMAHELTHALQDQHFNLRRFDKWPKGDSDAELAAHSLVEGEATIIMIEYSQEEGGVTLDVTKIPSLTDRMLQADDGSDSDKYPVLAAAPQVLKENLSFPYVYGVGFVQEVLKQRSWKTLDHCYEHLPSSSAQIIHPEKYLSGEEPIKIQIADLEPVLGHDWKRADQDINGEFGYMVLLEKFINKRQATMATSGWSGDRYALYENKQTGGSVLVQYSTWETANAAKQFFDAYSDRTRIRYQAAEPSHPVSGADLYRTSDGLAYLSIHDKDVVIVEGATGNDQLTPLVSLLWKSKKTAADAPK